MKKTPKVIIYNNRIYYKSLVPYKYKTRPGLYGYKGSYWTWEYSDNNGIDLIQKPLFEFIELSEWLAEKSFKAMLKHFNVKYSKKNIATN